MKLESFLNKTYPFFVHNLSISRQKGPPDRSKKLDADYFEYGVLISRD